MSMIKITVAEAEKICKEFGSKPCRVVGTDVVQIRGKSSTSDKYEDITWADFESALRKRKLTVYKSEKGSFLKIMKSK